MGEPMTDITQNITAPDRYLLRTTRRIGMLSYKSARVRFDHRTTVQGISFPAIFRLSDSELTRTFTQFYLSDGNQSLTLTGKVEAQFNDTDIGVDGAEVLIAIKAVDRYWNRVSGEWQVDFYANRFTMIDTFLTGDKIGMEANVNVETTLIPDIPGDEIEVTFYIARNFDDPAVISDYTDFINFQLTINNPAVAEGQNTAIDYQLTQQSAARGRYDDGSIWFGDGPTAYARSAITRDEAGDELTSEWRFSDEASPIIHANILLREVMDMKRTQVRGLTSDLLGEYKPCKVPNIDDFFHFFIGGNQNGKDNKWAANLFRLNRVTDAELSNGSSITSNHDLTAPVNVVFEYRDKDGVLIGGQSGQIAGGGYYGLEWVGENSFVYCDEGGRVARLDVNPDTGIVTRTEFADYPSGARRMDIDEHGNIYVAAGSVKKISPTGSALADDGSFWIYNLIVDNEHVYKLPEYVSENVPIIKMDRDTFSDVAQTTPLFTSNADDMIVLPDSLIHMRKFSNYVVFRLIRKSDMEIIKTIDSREMDNWYDPRRIIHDEKGRVFVLTYKASSPASDQILIFDEEFNYVDRIVLVNIESTEIAYNTSPYNHFILRAGRDIRVHNEQGAFIKQWTLDGTGSITQNARFLNAHPGRAALKFKVLGLTKQF